MGPEKGSVPENVQKRLDLFNMFYPLESKLKRRWAYLFSQEFKKIIARFKELALENDYLQEEREDRIIIWKNIGNNDVECMFYFIEDVTDLESVFQLYKNIQKYRAFLTYAIAHQKKDGDNVYDIFRCSRFSYLEHCNRVRYPI